MQGQAKSLILLKANKLRLAESSYLAERPDDVLVKTIATTITPGVDRLLLTNKPISHKVINYPIMLGSEMIGQVVDTGAGVTSVNSGDFVFTFKGDRWQKLEPYFGCHAEMVATSEHNVLPLRRPPIHRDLLLGLLGYVISGIEKTRLQKTSRVLILGLGSVGLMVAEYLNSLGITDIDALENFGIRGQLSSARNIGMDISDFSGQFNDSYDLIIEATGRILLVEKAIRMLKRGGEVLLLGNYEVLGYDYRLLQHKEPVLISSSITARDHLEQARTILENEQIDSEKFFTGVYPVDQFELAYRIALDSKEAIKTVISWV
ncbi:zinc-binding alcohol dehydrogenase [Prosthecochloris sp. N3]|uniref:Zinc-binding alcohol dehydrogenase n=1 Tax=Prosthecochloris ethylica TaxID=2743976 RepID=A0ABR9XTS1_9CHLB|nr:MULTISPECIES: zinc-binding alcohol dehydrogenase [Prosthecochloris]MBF0586973.1 zinc-binding alcohol dehydrogenase [Prosthecochloris ethylica]MBF0637456.1 zinc-binding alcohol dehydrogenase [Prosthecochloris ethylica]NUK48538.1 zinc-binding alcohol dehydrogenase [Prosthecochloris ethylica]RNA66132.1 alcohol dehydrogenase [Prosthecochloris sp. ZM_2]